MSARNWSFTQNDIKIIPVYDELTIRYLIYQTEEAPETKHQHLQGYIQMLKKRSLKQMKAILPGAHIEKSKGDARQNIAYCSKVESQISPPVIFGNFLENGERTDLKQLHAKFEDPQFDLNTYAQEEFDSFAKWPDLYTKYCRATKKPIKQVERERFKLTVIYGPAGLGKSRVAKSRWPGAYYKPEGKWWDTYSSQDSVILDDFSGSYFTIAYFKKLFDRYPLDVELKGGVTALEATQYVITTNQTPEQWWREEAQSAYDMPAIYRRITEFWEFYALNKYRKFISTSELSAYQAFQKSRTLTNAEKEVSTLFTQETQDYQEI